MSYGGHRREPCEWFINCRAQCDKGNVHNAGVPRRNQTEVLVPTSLTSHCEASSARMVEFVCSTNLFRTSQVGIFFRQTVNAQTEREVGGNLLVPTPQWTDPSSPPLSSRYLPAFRPPFVLDPSEGGGGTAPNTPRWTPGF